MPVISFDLNLGSLFSPLLLLVFAWIVNSARKAVERRVDARHAETAQVLAEIKAQVTKTNGRVDVGEELRKVDQEERKVDHDLLMQVVGQVNALLAKGGP